MTTPLAFLSLSEAAPARSPVEGRTGTGFADRSLMPKWMVFGPVDVPLGTARESDGLWTCPITPTRALVLDTTTTPPPANDLQPHPHPHPDRTTIRFPNGYSETERSFGVLDVTCAYAAVELTGRDSAGLLARFCAIDVRPRVMPVGAFRPGSVARTPGFVLRTGASSLLLLVGWALGEYLWDVVADAAGSLDA